MAAKVCIHMEGKKTTISNPGVSGFSCEISLGLRIERGQLPVCCKFLMKYFHSNFHFNRVKTRIFRLIFHTGLRIVKIGILLRRSR